MSNEHSKLTRINFAQFRPDLTNTASKFQLRCPLDKPELASSSVVQCLTGTHHISLKQVPSALTLKHGGSLTVEENTDLLLDAGFCIEEYKKKTRTVLGNLPRRDSASVSEISSVQTLLEIDSAMSAASELTAEEGSTDTGFKNVSRKRSKPKGGFHRRFVYEDFFSVVAGRFLAEVNGKGNLPRVLVWAGDVKRLQDPLSPGLFKFKEYGRSAPKNKIRFQDVSDVNIQMDFLMSHTHWGFKLKQLCAEETLAEKASISLGQRKSYKGPASAHTLRRVIRHYLMGRPDPRWTKKFTESVYEEPGVIRDTRSRSIRFLEVLKTVDGIISQRMISFPHENWSYEKYDILVLNYIWENISDEFVDGQLTRDAHNLTTRFSELKKARKIIKQGCHTGFPSLKSHVHFSKNARWTRFMLPLYEETQASECRMRQMFLIGTLSQTRGAGKPPLLVNIQSKKKFLQTVMEPDTTTDSQLMLIRSTMASVLDSIPDHAFTGLRTKASISVTASASWEKTQKEMGTVAAIQEICKDHADRVRARTFDLETGKPNGYLNDTATAGEYIFWRCLEEVLFLTTEQRRMVSLVVVDEPGKSRSITKGRACLKIVLDVVSKICAIPLAKGFDSSHSGMKASNHAWNFFRSFEEETIEDMLFKVKDRKETSYTDYHLVTDVYHTVFVSSTDYETATDFLSHKVGREIGVAWMLKCGIPRLLIRLVCEVAYGPRYIHYYGNLEIGECVDKEKKLFRVKSCRGILMGDPLTKVILHFVNIIVRFISFYAVSDRQKLLRFSPPSEGNRIAGLLSSILNRVERSRRIQR